MDMEVPEGTRMFLSVAFAGTACSSDEDSTGPAVPGRLELTTMHTSGYGPPYCSSAKACLPGVLRREVDIAV